ncbi:MAG: hypothetical protein IJ830_06255 [Alphaproteobacteria bacterium]|nr:hypothetical protein [Alphaproteobacteria bacterium]
MWFFFAVLASVVNAIYYLCNQNVRLEKPVFMIYRGIVVALMAVPFLMFYDVIRAWQFYAIAVMQGIITAYSDYKSLNANRKYGAETVASILPMNVATTFVLWCVIEPAVIYAYLQKPLQTVFILLSLSGIIFALKNYRKTKMTSDAFLYLLPVLLLGSVISVSNKTIMAYAQNSLLGLCFWRVFVSSLTVGVIHLMIWLKKGLAVRVLFEKQNLVRVWIFVFMPMSMVCRNMAMFYAFNPSYVSAIVQTSLLWIIFFNRYIPFIKFRKIYMKMNKKWAFLMLISAIVLILSTR